MSYNRNDYYSYIDERLNTLSYSVTRNGKLNLLHLHVHSEDFYHHFFNLLFGWNLFNLNEDNQNAEAVDLIDKGNKIILQVSSTCTKDKVQKSIDKLTLAEYDGYRFCFISIAKDAEDLRKQTFKIPSFINFDPSKDIYDITSVLRKVKSAELDKLKEIFDFIQKELGSQSPSPKFESNIAAIISILAQEDFARTDGEIKIDRHLIEQKIEFNQLKETRRLINQFAVYSVKLDKIYTDFDKAGINKSLTVLSRVESFYIKLKIEMISARPDIIFQKVIDRIVDEIRDSKNYQEMEIGELYLCVNVLAVDAFIRCKIFEDPTKYNYATP